MFHTIFYTPREELGYLLVHLGARRYERPGQGRVMHASESEDCIFADAKMAWQRSFPKEDIPAFSGHEQHEQEQQLEIKGRCKK